MASADSDVFHPQGFAPQRPSFQLGQHDSKRTAPLTDLQYGHLLNLGFNYVTSPITNENFRKRVFKLVEDHLSSLKGSNGDETGTTTTTGPDPILPPLTPEDTSLYPSPAVNTYTGYISPWIDLCSPNRIIASISRQVLNFEINYANFCGIRSLVILGPSVDASPNGGTQGLAQYSRAIQEAMTVGCRLTFLIHMPMYREPGVEYQSQSLSSLSPDSAPEAEGSPSNEVDLFASWESWDHIRSVCSYDLRLYLGRFHALLPRCLYV
jgi:protein arginine N-methyltransferase 5